MDQTLHRLATKETEEIKRTTKQKMARRHNREGGLGKQQTDDIGGGLHPAVDGQSLDETRGVSNQIFRKSCSTGLYTSLGRLYMTCQRILCASLHTTFAWNRPFI